jgi:hypothetical protein
MSVLGVVRRWVRHAGADIQGAMLARHGERASTLSRRSGLTKHRASHHFPLDATKCESARPAEAALGERGAAGCRQRLRARFLKV